MADSFQKTISSAFSWQKILVFSIQILSVFLTSQLTNNHIIRFFNVLAPNRRQAIIWTNGDALAYIRHQTSKCWVAMITHPLLEVTNPRVSILYMYTPNVIQIK